jgi:3-deoxy-D-manno-octulosonate 8-phosphate phosphatase (KDO 8-P phosphatase)
MIPKLLITDIDGVWTDGGMYYDQSGNELKKFNTTDSAGVLFARLLGIETAIITGEDTEIVSRRANKLKIKYVFQGVKNKLEIAKELCAKLNLQLSDVAYIGDDINDILLLDAVGFSAAPANAPGYVKSHAALVTKAAGGEGAFREFVETILSQNNMLDQAIELFLNNQRTLNQ